MTIRWGEVAGAFLTLIVLVALPLAAINYLPARTLEQLSASGIDLPSLAMQTAILGIILSAIALAKAVVPTKSVTYLILDISINVVTLAFALLVVGVGNIGSLGLSGFSLKQGKTTTEITIDLRIFIYLTLGAVTLSVIQSIVRFREARIEAKLTSKPN